MKLVTLIKLSLGTILSTGIIVVGGCSGGGSGSDSSTSTADVPIAFVKRPLNIASMNSVVGNPTDSVTYHQGGDLYILDKSSPSANAKNITFAYTQGVGDVADPEVSYDGKKIIFSMHCKASPAPASAKVCYDYENNNQIDDSWNIWEYDISSGKLRRVISSTTESAKGDDVDPAYLPDGRIVFSSNRQEKTLRTIGYRYVDEYDRETSTVLHTVDADGTNIEQISFNQSHDRNPTVLTNGQIMYSRWDHVGRRNQFSIFTANPDGTKMFIHYGAHSDVTSYLHPREMQDGHIMSDAMPLSRTNEGGALLIIDAKNFSEIDKHLPGVSGVGQAQASFAPVDFNSMVSDTGRFTTPYPLWDGSNRALVSFTPGGRTEISPRTNLITGQPITVEKAPAYGVYMLDLNTKGMRAIVLPQVNDKGDPTEFVTDAIPLMARTKPIVIPRVVVTASNTARFTVGSIYDTEPEPNNPALDRMTNNVLSAQEQADGIKIPMIPNASCSTCPDVADILKLKDPSSLTGIFPDNRPGRFARIVKAVPTPNGISREALGETEFEMQQILGYVPVEPDGSISFNAPADIPIGISVTDRYGRALQTHTSWIQGRPGELVSCRGCHSPRKGDVALNSGDNTLYNNTLKLRQSNGILADGVSGQTMAQIRFAAESGIDANNVKPSSNIHYTDVWTPTSLTQGTNIDITYAGLTHTDEIAPTIADGTIVINYPEHVQPILNNHCATSTCHDSSSTLDLSSGPSGSGRVGSYDALTIGKPTLLNGIPQLRDDNGEISIQRDPALAEPGLGRATRLINLIFPEGMKSLADIASDPSNATINHSAILNSSEKRLIVEWIDLGGQYYNDPCITRNSNGSCAVFRAVSGLDFVNF